ncbi:MAG: hypothetical protein HY553_08165, partial [Elusimicrobia bacterium]|nr:hypothetical protein [Elusimicrobiota bacterium]
MSLRSRSWKGLPVLAGLLLCAAFLRLARSWAATEAMVVYQEGLSALATRDLDTTNDVWGTVTQAEDFNSMPVWVRIAAAPVGSARPNEKVMVILDSNSVLKAMVFDGSTWGPPQILSTALTITRTHMRPYDVSYTGDYALVVYANGANTGSGSMAYQTWDGTSWSGESTSTNAPGTVCAARWVKLARHPTTWENALMVIDICNPAWVFFGRQTQQVPPIFAFNLPTGQEVTDANYEGADVAYEMLSGEILGVWDRPSASENDNELEYAHYNGTWSQGEFSNVTAANGDTARRVKLASRPGSDTIVVATYDNQNDLGTIQWNGTGETTFTTVRVETALRNTGIYNFDMAWEESGGQLVLAYTDSNNYLRYRTWGGSGDWGAESGNLATLATNAPIRSVVVFPDRGSDYVSIFGVTDELPTLPGGAVYGVHWDGNGISNGASGSDAPQLVTNYLSDWTHVPLAGAAGTLVYSDAGRRMTTRINNESDGSWQGEGVTQLLGGVRSSVLRSGTTREEKVLATLDVEGRLKVQVWTEAGGWSAPLELANGLAGVAAYRPFDVAYERKSGRAVIFYANSNIPRYNIWDGTTWLFGGTGAAMPTGAPAQSGTPWWIRAEANPDPNSDEIVVATLDNAATPDLRAYVWDGSSFISELLLEDTAEATAANNPITQVFDLAWESQSGRCMVIWGDNNSTTYPNTGEKMLRYRIWDTGPNTWGSETNTPDQDSDTPDIRWVRAVGDPRSNRIIMASSFWRSGPNTSLTLNSWNGSAWATATPGFYQEVVLNNLEPNFTPSTWERRPFDLGFEASGEQGLAVWSAANNDALQYRKFASASGSWDATTATGPNLISDPQVIRINADTITDEMYVLASNAQGMMYSTRWTGAAFDGPSTTLLGAVPLNEQYPRDGGPSSGFVRYEQFDASYHRDILKPVTTITAPTNNSHYNSLSTLSGSSNDPTPNASGLNLVELKLVRQSDGKCWTGTEAADDSDYVACGAGGVWFNAAGFTPWTKSITTQSNVFADGQTYVLTSRGTDKTGNVESATPSVTFVYDQTLPTGEIVAPKTIAGLDGYYSEAGIATVSGTANDLNPGDVNIIRLKLERVGDGQYYDGTNWNTYAPGSEPLLTPSPSNGTGLVNWSLNIEALNGSDSVYDDQETYRLYLRVTDKAGNDRATEDVVTFAIDETAPTITFEVPKPLTPGPLVGPSEEPVYRPFGFTAPPPPIDAYDGAAADNFVVAQIDVSIRNEISLNCWSHTNQAFNAACPPDPAGWFNANGTTDWTYTWPPATTNLDDSRLRLTVHARDAVDYEASETSVMYFRVDKTTPTIAMINPLDTAWKSTLTSIRGTAEDNARGYLEGVRVRIKRLYDNAYWNAGSWDTTPPDVNSANFVQAIDDRDGDTFLHTPDVTFRQTWTSPFTDTDWYKKPGGGFYTAADLSGTQFKLYITALDRARNRTGALQPHEQKFEADPAFPANLGGGYVTFNWDAIAPDTTLTSPVGATLGPGTPSFSGAATDAHADIDEVQYRLRRTDVGPNQYWTGAQQYPDGPDNTWVTVETWVTANYTGPGWNATDEPNYTATDSGRTYELTVRACDRAGDVARPCGDPLKEANVTTSFTGANQKTFTIDSTPPTLGIDDPAVDGESRNLANDGIGPALDPSGSAGDASGIATTEVQISKGCPGSCQYWNETTPGWQAGVFWNTTDLGGASWRFDFDHITLTDGLTYTVTPRATDTIGNQGVGAFKRFVWDVSPPTANVLFPSSGAAVSPNAVVGAWDKSVSGDAADPAPGQPNQAEIYIQDRTTGWYWDPVDAQFESSPLAPLWFAIADSPADLAWSATFNAVTWQTGVWYHVSARIRDLADNETGQSSPGNPGDGTVPLPIFYDTEKPVSRVSSIADGTYVNSLTNVSGTASDFGTGPRRGQVSKVFLHVYNVSQGQTYDWLVPEWDTGDLDLAAANPETVTNHWKEVSFVGQSSGTWSQSLTFLPSGFTYRITVRAKDWSGQIESAPVSVSFTYDAPAGSDFTNEMPRVTITAPANNLHTYSILTQLTGTAYDDVKVQSVSVMWRRFNANGTTDYWNGAAFTGTESWVAGPLVVPPGDSTSEAFTFNFPGADIFWLADTAHDVRGRAQDAAGNLTQFAFSTSTFVYDVSRPTATIGFPLPGGFVAETALSSGSAVDTGAGKIGQVQVRIQRNTDNRCLDMGVPPNGDWVLCAWPTYDFEKWNDATLSGNNPYTWTFSSAAWNSDGLGGQFTLNARAWDLVPRLGVTYSTVTFNADFQKPNSKVTLPEHSASYSSLPEVRGTAQDAGPAGIRRVWVSFRRNSDNKWFNQSNKTFDQDSGTSRPPGDSGSGSVGGNYWVSVDTDNANPVNWLATGSSTPTWQDGVSYTVLSAAEDRGGNVEDRPTTPAANSNRVTFSFVQPGPESGVTKPVAGGPLFKTGVVLQGTANDQTTLVEVQIKDVTDSQCWCDLPEVCAGGAGWKDEPCSFWVNVVGYVAQSPTWNFTMPADPSSQLHQYSIQSRSRRTIPAATESPKPARTFYLDDVAPVSNLTLPDTGFKNRLPLLAGNVTDDSTDPAPVGLANKTVYFRMQHENGNFWDPVGESFVAAGGIDCLTPGTTNGTCLVATPTGASSYEYTHARFTDGTAFTNDKQYTASLIARDYASNSPGAVSRSFRWDLDPPVAASTQPATAPTINSLGTLAGTASEDFSPVVVTSVSIRSLLDDKCFDGSFFTQTCPFWLSASGSGNATAGSGVWSRAAGGLTTLLGTYNTWYTILSRGIDEAGNHQTTFADNVSSRTFLFDSLAPFTQLTVPTDKDAGSTSGRYNSSELGTIASPLEGTAQDQNAPWDSGIRDVRFQLYYTQASENWYLRTDWTPIAFSSHVPLDNGGWVQRSVYDSGTKVWKFLPVIPWGYPVERVYTMKSRAEDASFTGTGAATGNFGNPVTDGVDVRDFIVDDTSPTVTLTAPAAAAVRELPSITGQVNADISGLDKVELKLARQDGKEWDGDSWETGPLGWLTASCPGCTTGLVAWSYSSVSGAFQDNNQYTISLRAKDLVGNTQTNADFTFKFDTSSPTLTIEFPSPKTPEPYYSNDSLSTRKSTFTWGNITDPGANASGVTQVWVAISSGLTGNDIWWNPASSAFDLGDNTAIEWSTQVYRYVGGTWEYTPGWTLKDGYRYSIFVKARDLAGNTTNYVLTPGQSGGAHTQVFHYDVTRPTATATTPANGSAYAALTQFQGSAADTGAGASDVSNVYLAVEHADGPTGQIGFWHWGNSAFTNSIVGQPSLDPDSFSPAWQQVASGPGAWTWPVPGGMFSSSNTYRVIVAAKDRASNRPSDAQAGGAGFGNYFRYDTESPSAKVTAPALAPRNPSTIGANITGTASDATSGASGIKTVQVLMKLNSPGFEAYWNGFTSGIFGTDWDQSASRRNNWRDVSAPLDSWTEALPPLPAGGQHDSRYYTIWVRTTDYANNVLATPSDVQLDANQNSDGSGAWRFIYDATPPTSVSTGPARYLAAAPFALAGNSSDAFPGRQPSGVNEVKLRLKRSDGLYWNFDDAWGGETWAGVLSAVDPWSMPVPVVQFADGYEYYVNSWAKDASANGETDLSTWTFTLDQTRPVSRVGVPAHNGFLGAVTQITGTADDRYCQWNAPFTCPGAGGRNFESGIAPSSVTVALMRYSDEKYWNGADFASNVPVWSTASFVGQSSGTWTYNLSAGALVDGSSYTASSRVVWDRAGNVETLITTNTFTMDNQAPVSLATAPTGAVSQMNALFGTARDPLIGQLDVVLLKIHHVSGPGSRAVWNGTGWTPGDDDIWVGTGTIGGLVEQTTYTWTFNQAVTWRSNANYEIKTRARDRAGNLSPIPPVPELTFTISGPQSGITGPGAGEPHFQPANLGAITGTAVNASTAAVRIIDAGPDRVLDDGNDDLVWTGAVWASTSPWPAICAADLCYIGASGYNGAPNPNTWSFAFPTASWTPGRRYRVQAKAINPPDGEIDFTGEETRTFIIDAAAPTPTVTFPAGQAYRRNQLGTLTGSVSDAAPGILVNTNVRFRFVRVMDGYEWDDTIDGFAAPASNPAGQDLVATPAGGNNFTYTNTELGNDAGLEDGLLYQIRLTGVDQAGNNGTVNQPAAGFRYDVSYPTATMTTPLPNVIMNRVGRIVGNHADRDPNGASSNYDPSGVTQVKIFVQSQQNGGFFQDAPTAGFLSGTPFGLQATVHETSFTYNNPDLNAAMSDGRYTLYVQAVDRALNEQYSFAAANSSFTILVDKTGPTIGLTQPALPAYNQGAIVAAGIGGNADDPLVPLANGTSSGLLTTGEGIDVNLWYVVGVSSNYWNGSNWVPSFSTLPVNGAAGWTLLAAPNAAQWAAAGDQTFFVRARAHDRTVLEDGNVSVSSGNVSAFTPDRSFIVDNTPPVSSPTWPVNGRYANAISSITGTANAAFSGLASVAVKITTNNATGPWWGGGGWTFDAGQSWRPAQVLSQTTWIYPGTAGDAPAAFAAAFQNDYRYLFYTRATDNAANQESSPPVIATDFDTTPPIITIARPAGPPSNPAYTSSDTVDTTRWINLTSGTVNDLGTFASGVGTVWVAVSSGVLENLWWDATSGLFTQSQANIHWTTNVFTGGTSWSTAPATFLHQAWRDGASYRLHVKACDVAGNCGNNNTAPGLSAAGWNQLFKFDLSRPTSTVTTPANGADQRAIAQLAGNASDANAAVSRVYAAVQHTGGAGAQPLGWWNWGSGAFDAVGNPSPNEPPGVYWTLVASTTLFDQFTMNWSTPAPANMFKSSETYRVVAMAVDNAGNFQAGPDFAGAGSSFRVDTSSPVAKVTAPVGSVRLATLGSLLGT